MKKFNKNNKGFSLVELIVVIAIMAVLMAVLVPTLIKNVEKTRLQTDKSAIAEVRQATITALAQDKYIQTQPSATGATIANGSFEIADLFSTDTTNKSADLAKEVIETIGSETIKLKSSLGDGGKVTLKMDARNGQVALLVTYDKGTDFLIWQDGEVEEDGVTMPTFYGEKETTK